MEIFNRKIAGREKETKTYSEDEIQQFVSRVQDGDTAAFDTLYMIFVKDVYQFLWFKTGHIQTAEDLTSMVFVKVWEALERYSPKNGAKFKTWLLQIARFTVIDFYRTAKALDDIDAVAYRIASSEDVERQVDQDQDAARVRELITNLPEKYQTVLTLRFINDLSVAETAEILGKTPGHVRVLQHRALKRVRVIAEESGEEYAFERMG